MKESEARLVYKNKITKNINLALFIASCVLVYITLLLSAFLLIVEGEKDIGAKVISYIFFGFAVVALILSCIRIGLMFIHSKDGLTKARFKAIDVVKLIANGTLIAAHITLVIGLFFLGSASVNGGFASFLKVYAIFILVLEIILFVYGLWRMAWIKENPERIYDKFAIKEAKGSTMPTKTSRKTRVNYSEPTKIEHAPKAIPTIDAEVKEIEVKK